MNLVRSRRGRRVRAALTAIALCVACSRPAVADPGGPVGLWDGWNWDPVLLLNLAILWSLYARGLTRLWRRGGVGRGIGRWQPLAFLAALAVLLAALVSPLDALSGELASAHMVQHLLLMLVAAPLFVLGAPMLLVLGGLPADWRRTAGRLRQRLESGPASSWLLWNPLVIWVLHAVAVWIWHIPALYESAKQHPVIHDLQHLTFFGTACLFWRVLLDPISRRRLHPTAAVLYLFAASIQGGALGAALTLSPRAWYPSYAETTSAWGLDPLQDQQLAGLVMWMPGGMVYLLAAAGLFGMWLSKPEGAGGPTPSPARLHYGPSAT